MRIKFLTSLLVMFATLSLNPSLECASTQNRQNATQRVLGLVAGDQKDLINAPATVRVGEAFTATVKTIGGGCESRGDEGVLLREDSATITVYDFTVATRPGVICTMIAKTFPHTVTLRFTKPGKAVIRFWVRRIGTDTPPEGAPVVLERLVTVTQ